MRRFLPLLLLATVACQRNQIHRVIPPDQRIDVLPQVSRAELDALFVIDNSRYMAVHQKRVADSFHRFVYKCRLQQWHGRFNAEQLADHTAGAFGEWQSTDLLDADDKSGEFPGPSAGPYEHQWNEF